MGLGLNVLAASAHLPANDTIVDTSGGTSPGEIIPPQRSQSGKAIQMDVANFGAMGDAASHASMIMQSRQAKLQRWRPNSSGKQVSVLIFRLTYPN